LRSWHQHVVDPEFLTAEQIAEYGRLYRLQRPGCLTTQAPPEESFVLTFEFTPETIRIRSGELTLAEGPNDAIVPTIEDQVSIGEGVFGSLTGVEIKVCRRVHLCSFMDFPTER
jgi:hypothetical protein